MVSHYFLFYYALSICRFLVLLWSFSDVFVHWAKIRLLSEVFVFFVSHRWRGVKLFAFENAKHKTYVDLKVRGLFVVDIKVVHSIAIFLTRCSCSFFLFWEYPGPNPTDTVNWVFWILLGIGSRRKSIFVLKHIDVYTFGFSLHFCSFLLLFA